MKSILLDPLLDKQLLEIGYIVIPFLSTGEVSDLKTFYYQFNSKKLEGMSATADLPDIDTRMQMNNTIRGVFQRAIRETLVNANALGGSFIAKGKGHTGTLSPHQDWNIVDEDHYRSFNIWVPLVDLKATNGAICVMPKSHSWIKSYRSVNIRSAYNEVEAELWQKMTRLYMKAGEALVYDHRLIHASGENKTDEIRLAAVFGIIPDEASMFYYHKKDETTIEVYESNKEFFLYENIFQGPRKLKKISELPYDFPLITPGKLDQFESGTPRGFFNRLKSVFNF